MSGNSRHRRDGRDSYFPGATREDRDALNPHRGSSAWGSDSRADAWDEGWAQAESSFNT